MLIQNFDNFNNKGISSFCPIMHAVVKITLQKRSVTYIVKHLLFTYKTMFSTNHEFICTIS